MSILVEIFYNSRFWSESLKISILVEVLENLDFARNLKKSRFWWKFSKISILLEIVDQVGFPRNI